MDDEEVILSEEEEVYLHGRCHLFAIALARLTGFELQAYLDVDDEVDRPVLCHAFVRDGDDILDVRGRLPFSDVLDEFDSNDPWLVDITEDELMLLGTGRRAFNENGRHFKKALAIAQGIVDRMGPKPTASTVPPP
jgi:hypothetical protein